MSILYCCPFCGRKSELGGMTHTSTCFFTKLMYASSDDLRKLLVNPDEASWNLRLGESDEIAHLRHENSRYRDLFARVRTSADSFANNIEFMRELGFIKNVR